MRKIIAFAVFVEVLAITTVAVNVARSYGIAGTQHHETRAHVTQSTEFSGPGASGVRWIGG